MAENKEYSYKITATLLNQWLYLFKCKPEYFKYAYDDFKNYLARIKKPPTEAMLRGLKFEQECYDGKVSWISDVIEGGAYQVFAKKSIELDDFGSVVVLGYLDVLKEGIIYDIKRVGKFEIQKYFGSAQHHIYFFLIPEAISFTYLIASGKSDNSIKYYSESYSRSEYIPVESFIKDFFSWLKQNKLFDVYEEHWKVENKKGSYL